MDLIPSHILDEIRSIPEDEVAQFLDTFPGPEQGFTEAEPPLEREIWGLLTLHARYCERGQKALLQMQHSPTDARREKVRELVEKTLELENLVSKHLRQKFGITGDHYAFCKGGVLYKKALSSPTVVISVVDRSQVIANQGTDAVVRTYPNPERRKMH